MIRYCCLSYLMHTVLYSISVLSVDIYWRFFIWFSPLFRSSDVGIVFAALLYLKTAISVAERKAFKAEFVAYIDEQVNLKVEHYGVKIGAPGTPIKLMDSENDDEMSTTMMMGRQTSLETQTQYQQYDLGSIMSSIVCCHTSPVTFIASTAWPPHTQIIYLHKRTLWFERPINQRNV